LTTFKGKEHEINIILDKQHACENLNSINIWIC